MSDFHGQPGPQQPNPYQPQRPQPRLPDPGQPEYGPKPPKKQRKWLPYVIPAGTFVLGLVIGAAPSSNSATDAASPQPAVTETAPGTEVTVTPPPVVKTVLKPGPTVKVTEKPAAAAATIDEGTWEVGADVAAGRYKTTAAVDSGMCYWKITTTGKPDNIVDNDIVTGGRPTVTLKKGQDFTTQDCGTWTKVG